MKTDSASTKANKDSPTTWLLITIGVAIVAFCAGYFMKPDAGSAALSGQGRAPQAGIPSSFQAPVGTKLVDAPFAKNAFLISTDTPSTAAQKALTGFVVSKATKSNGSVVYTLKATKAGYQDQTYTLTSGEQLYFVETFSPDDQGSADLGSRDDHAVVVDANGVIVQ